MKRSTSFRIRLVAGASLAFVDGMTFDILDTRNDLLCVYDYRGLSRTISTPVSASFRGPWNDFETGKPVEVDDFGGIAIIVGMGVMDKSLASLTLKPLLGMPVVIEPFQTGWSIGFGAGAGAGIFSRMFPPIDASRAPFPHNVVKET